MNLGMLKAVAPYVALALFSISIFYPVLFGGKAFSGEEQMGFYYAISYATSEAIKSGTPLFWQSAYYGGLPTSLDQFYGNFYPINRFLFTHFDFFLAHHLSITIATTLGLIFSYLFGRELGWRKSSSMLLGIFYFSATTLQWLEIGTIAAHSFMMLPALLYVLQFASVRRTKTAYAVSVFGGALALGIGFLAGFMQIVFYAYCIAGAYALFLDYEHRNRFKTSIQSLSMSVTYAGITVLGFLVGMKQFFPSAHLIDFTIRTNTYAIQNAYYPFVGELLPLILPPNFQIPYLGGGSSSGFYIGALGIVFAVLGLFIYRTRTVVFFTVLYCLMCAFAFHLPLFGWLNEHIPPFSRMGGNFRWMVAGAFPLAFLGASGIEGFIRNPEYVSRRAQNILTWTTGLITGSLIVGSILLQQIVLFVSASPHWSQKLISLYAKSNPLHFAPDYYVNLLAQALENVGVTFSLSNPPYLFGVVCWVIVFLFFFLYKRSHPLREYAPLIIFTVSVYSVIGASIFVWRGFIPQDVYSQKPQIVEELTTLESDPYSYRILGFLIGDGIFDKIYRERTLSEEDGAHVQLELLINNSNLYYGIERMDGMAPYRTLRANRLMDTVVASNNVLFAYDDTSDAIVKSPLTQLYNRDVMRSVTKAEKLDDFFSRLPLVSMMNVKYIYSLYELDAPSLTLVKNFNISAGERDIEVFLYNNEDVLPRAYLAENVVYASSEREALLKTVSNRDFRNETIIECRDCPSTHGTNDESSEPTHIQNGVEIEVSLDEARWLVVSESTLPGWAATVDGEHVPIYVANYLFQAVLVPKGQHTVRFEYTDETLYSLLANDENPPSVLQRR